MSKNINSVIIKATGERAVAYNPLFAEISGSVNAGLLLSQLLYWWGKGKYNDWIYKSAKEITLETQLSTSQQTTAIKIWLSLSVLTVQVKGLPPTKFFRINLKMLYRLIEEAAGYTDFSKTMDSLLENEESNSEDDNN